MAKQTLKSMKRREFIAAGAAGIAGHLVSGCTSPERRSVKPANPNILLIVTDQQHIDTIAAAGCVHARTPALDSLVDNGIIFTECYCTNPLCSPSRSSMFSGRASSECGVIRNEIPIRSDFPNIGQWLSRETDYESVYAGKWHLPATYAVDIPGFNVLTSGLIGQGNFCDTQVSMACEAFIRNHPEGRPFFMVASFMQPHDICEWLRLNLKDQPELRYPHIESELPELPPNFSPVEGEPEDIRRRRERDEPARGQWSDLHWRYYLWSYYRHIEMVDAEIGRILAALEDTNHRNDTVVLFMADHGEGTAHHKMVRKSTPYDEASKVPFIVSWPGTLPEKTIDTGLVSGLDIVPTVCDFAGVAAPGGTKGRSLRPIMESRQGASNEFIALECSANGGQMIRTDGFKYVVFKDDPVEQLFDMQNDPYETRNLAADSRFADALENHRNLLKSWISGLDIAPDVPEENRWFFG